MKILKSFIALFVFLVSCNGQLQGAENELDSFFSSLRVQDLASMVGKYDVNHDGKLDAEEAKVIGKDMMLNWDLNNDGKVDRRELRLMRQTQISNN